MDVGFEPLRRDDAAALGEFLASEAWPFHGRPVVDAAEVERAVRAGEYDGPSVRTHWVVVDGRRRGVLRAFDLDDGAPLFDLRLAASVRGRGVGHRAVRWLVGDLFDLLPDVTRIEATTRADNAAMRAVLRATGFVKEAHYRRAWPVPGGAPSDAVGYAVLREDWLSGSPTPVDWDDEAPPPGAARRAQRPGTAGGPLSGS